MNEIKFKNWLLKTQKNTKVCSDIISRLRKFEKELRIDTDEEYESNHCEELLKLFENTGRNEQMEKYSSDLPIGKYYLSTYKYAIKIYIKFRDLNK